MSGSISDFFDDVGNEIEDAADDVANEVGDAADDVDDEVAGDNDAPSTPTTAAPPAPAATPAATPAPAASTAQVERLYDAAFDRAPDSGGLAAWTAALQGGVSLDAVADQFAASPEFQSRYGGLDTGGFVELLYRSALEREVDSGGRAAWTAALDAGALNRADVLLAISQSPESAAGIIGPASNDDPLV